MDGRGGADAAIATATAGQPTHIMLASLCRVNAGGGAARGSAPSAAALGEAISVFKARRVRVPSAAAAAALSGPSPPNTLNQRQRCKRVRVWGASAHARLHTCVQPCVQLWCV